MPWEAWICQPLNIFVNSEKPSNPKNGECATCGPETLGVKSLKISETKKKKKPGSPGTVKIRGAS